MELKRILARDSRSANDKALQLYGADVLVISSQRVDNQTELIVAVDTQEDGPGAATLTSPQAIPSREQDRFVAFSDVFKVSVESPPPAAVAPVAPAAAATQQTDETAAPPPHWMTAPTQPQPAPAHDADAHALAHSRDTVELLRQEIAALRQEFNLNRQVAMWQTGQGLSPELRAWFAHLQELGVPASLRTLMADAVQDRETMTEAWPDIQANLTAAIERRKMACPGKGVHALVGPSGSGKTLMVARLVQAASAQMAAEDMAIISFADSKAGAWSQMQVLAAQSGVSCYRAGDIATLEVLLSELSAHRAIWIDTPGTDFMARAMALQGLEKTVSLHAVLALDATVTNVRKIFDSSNLTWKSLMLTKADEAAHPWPVLKALCDHPLPVSAVGGSHKPTVVPEAFDAAALVCMALQGLQPEALSLDPPVQKKRRRPATARAKALNG